jgi:hypothetical protein
MNLSPFYLDHQKDSGHRLDGYRVVPLERAETVITSYLITTFS